MKKSRFTEEQMAEVLREADRTLPERISRAREVLRSGRGTRLEDSGA